MITLPANQVDANIIKNFLQNYEHFCVTLCSLVRKDCSNVYILLKETSNEIWGVLHIDKSISHCLPFLKSDNFEFEKIFTKLIDGRQIKCIDGEKKATEIMVNVLEKLGRKKFFFNDYFLMTKEDDFLLPAPASLLSMGEEIVCCNSDHCDDLYELQFQYLKEEVVPAGKNPTEIYVRSNLKAILKNQKVFAIETDGKFVAKVNTNAIGWNWVQIGGVYTEHLYRRNGYSLCLVSTLCRRINKTGRKMCLFVNKKNFPAIALYEKLDFKKSCDFQIVYFE